MIFQQHNLQARPHLRLVYLNTCSCEINIDFAFPIYRQLISLRLYEFTLSQRHPIFVSFFFKTML